MTALATAQNRSTKMVVDLVLHDKAGRRDADLSGVAEFRSGDLFRRHVDVGIVEDDDRRVAAEFHGDALHMLAGEARKQLADRRRAGEGHLADDRVGNEIFADLRGDAEDEADDARGNAGIDEAADQFGRRGRCFFRRLDDDRAAGGERRG